MRYVFFRHSLFWNAHYSSLGVYQEIQCTYMAYTGTHNGSFSPHLMQAFCHLFGGCLSLCGLEKCFHEYGLIQITKYKVTFKDTMCIHWGVYQRNPLVSSFHSQICTAHPNPTVRDANEISFYSAFFCRRIWSHIKMLRAPTVCKISGHLSFFRLHSQIGTLQCTGTQANEIPWMWRNLVAVQIRCPRSNWR